MPLSPAIVQLGQQLDSYNRTNPRAFTAYSNCRTYLRLFVANHPTVTPASPAASSARSTRRSASVADSPPYPPEWLTSPETFRRAVDRFVNAASTVYPLTPSRPSTIGRSTGAISSRGSVAGLFDEPPPDAPTEQNLTNFPNLDDEREFHTPRYEQGETTDTHSIGESQIDRRTPTPTPRLNMTSTLNDAALEQISALIDRAFERRGQGPPGPPGEPGPPGPAGTTGTNGSSGNHFRIQEIGLFHPNLPVTPTQPDGDSVQSGNDLVIRNVHFFIERIKDSVASRGEDTVKANLSSTFRGSAAEWYTDGLSRIEKTGLRHGPIDDWYTTLRNHFKEPTSKAIDRLLNSEYTLADAAARKDVSAYVYNLLRTANSGNITDKYAQLTLAYQKIHPLLQATITAPNSATTVNQFVEQLRSRQETWISLADYHLGRRGLARTPAQPSQGQYNRGQSGQGSFGQNPGRGYGFTSQGPYSQGFGGRRPFQSDYSPYASQYPRPYQSQYQQQPQPPASANAPPPRLTGAPPQRLLTNGPATPMANTPHQGSSSQGAYRNFANRAPYGGGQGFQSNRPPYQQRPFQRAYFGDAAEEDEAMACEACRAGVGDALQHQHFDEPPTEEPPTEPTQDSTDAEHEVEAGFVSIGHVNCSVRPAVCRTCQETFESQNRLHIHLRTGCKPASKKALPQRRLVPDNEIVEASILPPEQRGRAYRSWRYATVGASLQQDGTLEDLCVDSGCTPTLGDRAYLLSQGCRIKTLDEPMTLNPVGEQRLTTNEYVEASLYIPGKMPDGRSAVGCIPLEIHVLPKLQAKLLVGADTLNQTGMVLNFDQRTLSITACQGLMASMKTIVKDYMKEKRIVKATADCEVPAFTTKPVPISVRARDKLRSDRDYSFIPDFKPPQLGATGGTYHHLVDLNVNFVLVANATAEPYTIRAKTRLGTIRESNDHGAMHIASEHHVAAVSAIELHQAIGTAPSYAWASHPGN